MADVIIQQPIRSVYKDGSIVVSNVKSKIDNGTTSYSVVNAWYDGTPMDDSKVDQWGVYSKYKATGEYLRENKPNWGELFLEVDTLDNLRTISGYFKHLLLLGYYKGVRLNGYYQKNDTPAPIEYYVSATSETDNGGNIIVLGTLKLEHFFLNKAFNIAYFGVKEDTTTPRFTEVLSYLAGKGVEVQITGKDYWIDANHNSNRGLVFPSNLNLTVGDKVVFRAIPTNTQGYSVITLDRSENVFINRLVIEGERNEHVGTVGEWGFGLAARAAKNVRIGYLEANNCWGDGLYVGKWDILGEACEDIVIDYFRGKNNRRQGITLVTVKNFLLNGGHIKNTNGTNPQAGIDFEPNHKEDFLQGIRINNLTTENNAGTGILLAFTLFAGTLNPVDITINGHRSIGERAFNVAGGHFTKIGGRVIFNDAYYINSKRASLYAWNYVNMPDLIFNKPYIMNWNRDQVETTDGCAIRILLNAKVPATETDDEVPAFEYLSTDVISKIEINEPVFHMDAGGFAHSVMQVQRQNDTNYSIKGVKIRNPKMTGQVNTFRYRYFGELDVDDAYDELQQLVTENTNDVQSRLVKRYHNTGVAVSSFVFLNPHMPNQVRVKIEYTSTNIVSFGIQFLNNIGYIIGLSTTNGMRLETGQRGAYIIVQQVSQSANTWRIVEACGVWRLVEGASVKNVAFNQKQAKPISDASSTDIVDKFNLLLANLKGSNLME